VSVVPRTSRSHHLRRTRRPHYLVYILLFISCSFAFADKPNVLLISIDTLRADHLGCYGYTGKTPAMDSLASQSVLFETAISQVPLTLPSHCTILTGLYPDQHGVRNNENFVLSAKVKTLAESFQENGYSTGAFVGSFSLDSSFGIQQGFQLYEDRIGQGHDPEINRNVERRAESVWKLARAWLENQKGPWFAFLHFFDPHFPYNPPSPYPQTYDGEIAYSDHVVESIVQFLKEKQYISTTIIVLLSDHGESLGEHGEDNHGVFLYDATLKVPLLIRAPGYPPARIRAQVRLVDVSPTIAELAGLKNIAKFSGRSLATFMKGQSQDLPAYSETYYSNLLMGWAPLHSIRWGQKKWIDAPKAELYDLTRDPKELKNIYTSDSIPAAVRSELQKHSFSVQPSAESLDSETKEKLASLGYITGGSAKNVSSGFDPKDGINIWRDIEAAVRFAQLGKWSDSETYFRSVLKKEPENVIAQKFLGNVLKKQGKNEEAIVFFKRALKSDLHQTETRNELAEAFVGTKQYREALEQLALILKTTPHDMRALTLSAWLQSQLSMDSEALNTYTKLSALRSLSEAEALDAAGISLTNRRIPEAEKYFRAAIDVNPKSSPAWKGQGLISASRKEWDSALDAFLKAGDCADAKNISSEVKNNSLLTALRNQCP
jgi:choline-sulfatase